MQDSERANLCKIVARGGGRGKQACKGACKRLGGCCVCQGEGGDRTEGPGGGGEGCRKGCRWWKPRAPPAGLGVTPVHSGSGPALYGSVWSPSPESTLPSSSIPPAVTPAVPTLRFPLHTHSVFGQLPPPVRCKCLAGIGPPGDLQPWETRGRAQFERSPLAPGERTMVRGQRSRGQRAQGFGGRAGPSKPAITSPGRI